MAVARANGPEGSLDPMEVPEADLLRWSEALAGIARTGLGFTKSLYEQERFEEVLRVAADISVAAREGAGSSPLGEEGLKLGGESGPGGGPPQLAGRAGAG